MASISDFAWQHASRLTEETDKRKVLEYFVNRVREGKPVNSGVMKFIADGVEQHLKGKKPWGAKQGKKKRSVRQELYDTLPIYTEYQRIGFECLETNECVDPGYVLVTTAEKFGISEDTVMRAIASVKNHEKSVIGKLVYNDWMLEQEYKRFFKSPEGRAYLETPEGREEWGDSPFVREIMNQS